jgi:hypothetical protein
MTWVRFWAGALVLDGLLLLFILAASRRDPWGRDEWALLRWKAGVIGGIAAAMLGASWWLGW